MPVVLTLKKRTNCFARITHTPPGTSGSAESGLNPCVSSYRSDRTQSTWKTVCRITQYRLIGPHSPQAVRPKDAPCSVQFSRSVVSDSLRTPWTAARQASLSIPSSRSLLKLVSIQSVMPSSHLILCRPLLLLPSIFPSIRVFSKESVLRIRWPQYWGFSFNISPSNQLQHQSFQWTDARSFPARTSKKFIKRWVLLSRAEYRHIQAVRGSS